MASGDDRNNMLFDLRSGRRRNVVKVVYATLAVLMGLSLFLVIGGFNIAELFQGNATVDAASEFEDDAERIEDRLRKDPENPRYLLSLTRARVNAGNALYSGDPGAEVREITPEAIQQLRLGQDAWERYLEATGKPNPSGAVLMSTTLLTLAENARSSTESKENVEGAVQAAKIVADQKPSLGSLSTLAFYTALLARKEQAEAIADKAKKLAPEKLQRESIDKEVDRYLKIGEEFNKSLAQIEAAEKQAGAQGGAQTPSGENPLGGAGLTGPALGE
jgi:hypothetical protein